MIKNQGQYGITKAQADRFRSSLENLRKQLKEPGWDPAIDRIRENALASQLASLEQELLEYEQLQAGLRGMRSPT